MQHEMQHKIKEPFKQGLFILPQTGIEPVYTIIYVYNNLYAHITNGANKAFLSFTVIRLYNNLYTYITQCNTKYNTKSEDDTIYPGSKTREFLLKVFKKKEDAPAQKGVG